jgi:protein-S-isoprenylcysteine O-methyltransferase Ste14
MYMALVTVILGEALWFGTALLAAFAILLLVATHLRVLFYEEPTLRRLFGAEYDAYARRVPRWLFRL